VIIATDKTKARSILVMKDDYDNTIHLSDKLQLSARGESGDATQFERSALQDAEQLRAVAARRRRNLADYLRSRLPFNVNLLIAGYDNEKDECEFYVLNYLAAIVTTKFVAHNYGGFFSTAILDNKYRDDMTREEAYDLLKDCVHEIKKRLIINMPNFHVKIVEK
jgi:20S proteasome subunit beta 4